MDQHLQLSVVFHLLGNRVLFILTQQIQIQLIAEAARHRNRSPGLK